MHEEKAVGGFMFAHFPGGLFRILRGYREPKAAAKTQIAQGSAAAANRLAAAVSWAAKKRIAQEQEDAAAAAAAAAASRLAEKARPEGPRKFIMPADGGVGVKWMQ